MQSRTLILKGESNGNLEVVSCLVKLFHFPLYSRERKKEKGDRKQMTYSTVDSTKKLPAKG